MTAVRTIRRKFTVDGMDATLSVALVAGQPIGVSVEWDSARPPRLRGAALARYRKLRNAIKADLLAAGRIKYESGGWHLAEGAA
jgi:hypothetical protein